MNKKSIRIAGWTLGLSLALGGAGVAAASSRAFDKPMEATATDVQDKLFAKGFGDYTTGSYSAGGTDYTAKANSTDNSGVTYALQVFNGSTGQIRGNSSGSGNFSARNTTTYADHYISRITLTVTGGTLDGGTTDRSVVWFNSSAYGNPSTAPSKGTKVSSKEAASGQTTLTWENSDTSYNYFCLYNLKTASSAKSESAATSLVVTWSEKPHIPSITLDQNSKDLYVPESFELSAEYEFLGGTLTWSTSDSNIADISATTGDKITVTAVAEGSATITAYDSADEDVKAECTVNVSVPAVPTGVEISGFDGSPLSITDTLSLSATVTATSGTPSQAVVWSSSDENVATVSSGGEVQPKKEGNVTITATANGYPAVYATVDIRVYDPIFKVVTSQSMLQSGDTVLIGGYNAELDKWIVSGAPSTNAPSSGYNYWTNNDVGVSVSDGILRRSSLSQAAFWTYLVSSDKQYFKDQSSNKYLGAAVASSTPKSGEYASYDDRAAWDFTFNSDGSVRLATIASPSLTFDVYNYKGTLEFKTYAAADYSSTELRLFKLAGAGIPATSVTPSVESVTVTAGNTVDFTYEVAPAFNTDVVSVSSSDETVFTLSEDAGTYTVNGVAEGTANVLFKNSADETIGTIPVTVNAAVAYDHITVDASGINKTYTVGDAISTAGTVVYAYRNSDESDTPVDVTLESTISATPATASTVSDNFAVTISASFNTGSGVLEDTDDVEVVVNPILVTAVTLEYAKSVYEVGSNVAPTAIGVNAEATDQTVTVTSSEPDIIQVTDAATGELSFLKAGTATITATANDGSGVYKSVELTSTLIYGIDRFYTTARFNNLDGSYQSGNVVSHVFDGIELETKNVMKSTASATKDYFQVKSSSSYLKNVTSLGGPITKITLANFSGTVAVSGSTDGTAYTAITGSDGVYTSEAGYTYFKITASATTYFSSIAIELGGDFADHVRDFASEFNTAVGDDCASFSTSKWAALKSSFDGLTSDEKEACAFVTVSDLKNGQGTELDKAMRRYDNILTNYGMEDFIDRSGSGMSGLNNPNAAVEKRATSLTAIIVLSAIGVVTAAGLAFVQIKRRREHQ